MPTRPLTHLPPCGVLTLLEAATLYQMNEMELRTLLQTGEIPAIRGGKAWKIPVACMEAYVLKRAEREAVDRRKASRPKAA